MIEQPGTVHRHLLGLIFGYRTLWNVYLRDQPALVGLIFRKIERSEISSLPIGRIAERIAQAIREGPQLG